MRLLDLLLQFDEALDWPLDDPLLAERTPSDADEEPWPLASVSAA